jgi:hypothetical protein
LPAYASGRSHLQMVSPPEYYPLSPPAAPLLLISAALAFLGGDADSSACCYFIPYSSFHDRQVRVRKSARSTISSVLGGYSDRFAGRAARGFSKGCGAPAIALAAPRLGYRCYQHNLCSRVRYLRCDLAFSIFLVWNEIHDLQTTEYETGNVEDLYRLAGQFVEPERG